MREKKLRPSNSGKGALLEYKLRAGFPLMQYLQRYYPDGRVNATGQFNATCCQCDKKDKFYYDIKKFKGLCQSCFSKRDGAGFKTILSLIMFTESLEYSQAIERLKSSSVTQDIGSSILEEVFKFRESVETASAFDLDLWDIPINVDIPMRIPPDMERIEEYFNSRKNPMRIDILDVFPAYMSTAKFLQNRMIFEIKTGESYAWLGYLMGQADDDNPKTLNPRGSVLSYMLGGYNYFADKTAPLLLHEGIFDMFRSVLRGYSAVCSFGKVLSPKQLSLLNDTKSEELVLCYDGDTAGLKAMWSIIKKWRKHITKRLSMMIIPYGKDPDEYGPKSKYDECFEKRRLIT